MEIKPAIWNVKKLIDNQDLINPKPSYQRSSVWNQEKKLLLIDSILKGYDLPKFYLVENSNNLLSKYEVEDGQQRIRAIWEFVSDDSTLVLQEFKTEEWNIKNLSYADIKLKYNDLHKKFLAFKIDIALITKGTAEEIRILFARLQMGERLNSAELRNAIASNIGTAINSIVQTHKFFKNGSKIKDVRFKHQEYLDNAITASYNKSNTDIKAPDLKALYYELSTATLAKMQPLVRKTNKVLDLMHEINLFKPGIFKNKWTFVDIFYLLYTHFEDFESIENEKFANAFFSFEKKRVAHYSNPDDLINEKNGNSADKPLFDYLNAYKSGGAEKKNIQTRYEVLKKRFFIGKYFKLKK